MRVGLTDLHSTDIHHVIWKLNLYPVSSRFLDTIAAKKATSHDKTYDTNVPLLS